MKVYLLNSAVMTQEGVYTYKKISKEEFISFVKFFAGMGKLVSYIGYEQNAKLIRDWAGVEVEVNRKQLENLNDGDLMLVMKLKYRVENPATKGAEVSEDDFEFALVYYKQTDVSKIPLSLWVRGL
jgi:hypothetical protein